MGIFLRHSWNVKPPRWGSFADVQYAIRINSEKIYGIDPDNDVLVMPLFWGLPLLDYSGYNNNGTNHGTVYQNGGLLFGDSDNIEITNDDITGSTPTKETFLLSVMRTFSSGDVRGLLSSPASGTGTPKRYLQLSSTNEIRALPCDVSYTGVTTSTVPLNKQYQIAWVRNGTSNKIFMDRIEEVDSTITATCTIGTAFYIGSGFGGTFPGIIFNCIVNKINMSANQIALFYDRPWDLYRPVSRPVWSIPAAETGVQHFMLLGVG